MSNSFAIAAVTAVLKNLLDNGVMDHDLSAAVGGVKVTAFPPDRVLTDGGREESQLNLYMYHVTPNQGWRNVGLPSYSSNGERVSNPPLALDLHYLLTAYGKEEFHADALLGYGMQLLHETPILTRAAINKTLKPSLPDGITLPQGLALASTADLAEQVEQVKICPQTLSSEEMSKLWMMFQTRYRPTAAYQVTVVLIESDKPAKAPLPVLSRGQEDRGPIALADMMPPFPTIDSLALPNRQVSALMQDQVKISGHHFAGEENDKAKVNVKVRLTNAKWQVTELFDVPEAQRDDKEIAWPIPNAPKKFPPGFYTLSVQVAPKTKPDGMQESNEMSLVIAPKIVSDLSAPITLTAFDVQKQLGTATITLQCTPQVKAEQRVSLVLGSREILAQPHPDTTNAVTFIVKNIAAGKYFVRLRVDGSESLLVDRSDAKLPKFDAAQQITLQAPSL